MAPIAQELMTPHEAARWFRRSPSWLRHQAELLRFGGPGTQPLYHVRVCRAYVLGQLCGFDTLTLRRVQVKALAGACGVSEDDSLLSAADLGKSDVAVPTSPDDIAAGRGFSPRSAAQAEACGSSGARITRGSQETLD